MIEIKRKNLEPLIIEEATTVKEAVEYAVRNHISLEDAELSGVNLYCADLSHANLCNADLTAAILCRADLSNANLCLADLSGVDLFGADLTDANLFRANLFCADLTDADLSHVDLFRTDLSNADLTRANLSGANLDYSCLPLWCGSLNMKIDKRIFCQLLYHTLRAGKSIEDEEVVAFLRDKKALALANQFHRVQECGKIKMEEKNENL